jgi:hypothetical protein
MQPIKERGHWRVKMTWPQSEPRYFGKFVSEVEAQHWIADHPWLERQVEPAEETNAPQ